MRRRRLGWDPGIPGDIDIGVEYRLLAGITAQSLEHGALVELQYAPVEQLRIGLGYNFTSFSDNELARDDRDFSGLFLRAVGHSTEKKKKSEGYGGKYRQWQKKEGKTGVTFYLYFSPLSVLG